MHYDVIIIGAGPGGIYSAYELILQNPVLKIAVFEAGHALQKRNCPIDSVKVTSCIGCKSCSIMNGFGGEGTKLYSTAGTKFKKVCIQNDLHLLDASVRHLGTDKNYVVLENLYQHLQAKVDFYFDTPVESIAVSENGYQVLCKSDSYTGTKCIVSVGRSGSKWMEKICQELQIPTQSNRVDIGVRVALPTEVFSHLTDELYESKP